MSRETNVKIFEDTMKLNKNLFSEKVREALRKQKIILETDHIKRADAPFKEDAEVIISKKRSFEAASAYKDKKVCVLNFASSTTPGGGVVKGSSAQEECLCRVSTLYPMINCKTAWNKFYGPHRAMHNPLYNGDLIYSPDVVVFKSDTDTPKLLPEEERYNVNVVSCAAPNLRRKPSNRMNSYAGEQKVVLTPDELFETHLKRGRRVLDVAVKYGNEVAILGAWGCGAFQNSPEIVAKACKQLAHEYSHHFEIIEFAVYCPPENDTNFRVFQEVFEK